MGCRGAADESSSTETVAHRLIVEGEVRDRVDGLPPVPPPSATAQVGVLEGQPSVDALGVASYTVALETPPGAAGLSLPLALVYRSDAGDGAYGLNWSLSGVPPVIRRCPKTWARDGINDGVTLTVEDRVCFGEQPLGPVNGSSTLEFGEYRTREDSLNKVRYSPKGFDVYQPNDRIISYAPHGRITGGETFAWYPATIHDRYGNLLHLHYSPTFVDGVAAEVHLRQIAYAGRTITFVREPREDRQIAYRNGLPRNRTELVTRIEIAADGQLLHTYRLNYERQSPQSRSQLSSIELCDASGTCLPPTSFVYESMVAGFAPPTRDGYGPPDDLIFYNGPPSAAFSSGRFDGHLPYVADMDANGLDDFVYPRNGRWRVTYHSKNGAPREVDTGISANDFERAHIVQFNGDEYPDILLVPGATSTNPGTWRVVTPTADGRFPVVDTGAPVPALSFGAPGDPTMTPWEERGHLFRGNFAMTLDYNGDGFTDILAYSNSPGRWILFTNNRAGTFSTTVLDQVLAVNQGHRSSVQPTPMDLDLDGDVEIMFTGLDSRTEFSTAVDFTSSGLPRSHFRIGYNVLLSPSTVGHTFVRPRVAFADFNGDGYQDLMWKPFPFPSNSREITVFPGVGGDIVRPTVESSLGEFGYFAIGDLDYALQWGMPLAQRIRRFGSGRDFLIYPGYVERSRPTYQGPTGTIDSAPWRMLWHPFDAAPFQGADIDEVRLAAVPVSAGLASAPYDGLNTCAGNGIHPREEANPTTTPFHYPRARTGDFNGDGRVDLSYFYCGHLYVLEGRERQTGILSQVFHGEAPSSERAHVHFEYDWAASSDSYTRGGSCPSGYRCNGPKRLVVTALELLETDSAAPRRAEFDYEQHLYDIVRRQPLGFTAMTRREVGGAQVRREFAVGMFNAGVGDYALGRRLLRSETTYKDDGNEQRRISEVYTYHVRATTPGSYLVRPATEERVEAFGDEGVFETMTESTVEYAPPGLHGEQAWRLDTDPEVERRVDYEFFKSVNLWLMPRAEWVQTTHRKRGAATPGRRDFRVVETRVFNSTTGALDRVVTGEWSNPQDSSDRYDPATLVTFHVARRDGFGNAVEVHRTAPGFPGQISYSVYDLHGVAPIYEQNAVGHETLTRRVPGWARPGVVQDPKGEVTTYQYDGLGRLSSAAVPGEGTYEVIRQNASGVPEYAITYRGPSGAFTIDYFDRAHRQVAVQRSGLNSKSHWVGYRYDSLGRLVGASVPDTTAPWSSSSLQETTWGYDEGGNVEWKQAPDGARTTYRTGVTAVGEQLTTTDPLGRRTTETANRRGDLVQVVTPAGQLRYVYNGLGMIVQIVQDGATTTVDYDGLGRRSRVDDPDAGDRTMAYDPFGRIKEIVSPEAGPETIAYDAIGRPMTRTNSDGVIRFTWDAAVAGTLSRAESPDGVVDEFTYDQPGGRMGLHRRTINGTVLDTTYRYDSFGRMQHADYPSLNGSGALRLRYTYDNPSNRLREVHRVDVTGTRPDRSIWALSATDRFGELSEATFGHGLIEKYSRDPLMGRLTELRVESSADTFVHRSYGYDPTGRLRYRRDHLQSVNTESFRYNAAGQLSEMRLGTTATPPGLSSGAVVSASFDSSFSVRDRLSYAPGGFLTSRESRGQYEYGPSFAPAHAPVAVIRPDGTVDSFTYDADGHQRTRPDHILAYNASFGKVREVFKQSTGARSTYQYGAFGDLAQANHSGTTTYAGAYRYERVRFLGTDIYSVRVGGRTVAEIHRSLGSEEIVYHHQDRQGSTIARSSANGAGVVSSVNFDYDAFGARRDPNWSSGGSPGAGVIQDLEYGYTGHRDTGHGLIDAGGRWYDPQYGHFLSPDPFIAAPGDPRSFNRYAYTFFDPINFTDPSGYVANDTRDRSKEPGGKRMPKVTMVSAGPENGERAFLTWVRIFGENETESGSTQSESRRFTGITDVIEVDKGAPGTVGNSAASQSVPSSDFGRPASGTTPVSATGYAARPASPEEVLSVPAGA